MLRHIHVQNYAIVSELEQEFSNGFHVFTGETGAGKSIMVGALSLALGARSESGIVRQGQKKSNITATFCLDNQSDVLTLLEEQGIDCDDEDLILRRQINADGRSRAFVNGIPTSIQSLARIGELLIDIHGQHAHQSLLRHDIQRELLDQHARHQSLIKTLGDAYKQWQSADSELTKLQGQTGDHAAEMDLLQYQIDELHDHVDKAEAFEQIQQQHTRLHNLTQLLSIAQQAQLELTSSEDSTRDKLAHSARLLADNSSLDARLGEIAELINTAVVQLDEADSELSHYVENAELDPQQLQLLDQQMDTLNSLARKHRVEIEQLPEHFEQLKLRLANLENSSERREQLEGLLESHHHAYFQAAENLSNSRRKHAVIMSEAISEAMQTLGMEGGRFNVDVKYQAESDPAPLGLDKIDFLVSANQGQDLRPLNKVASGGELSRISLAIQVIAANNKGVPTLVFDEVDVGIGGSVAEIVGRLLRKLGQSRQVLCVTHLPQVAALGHHHFSITKNSQNEETSSQLANLGSEERINEIARMLGGMTITEQTLAHASEMLENAHQH